MRKWKGHKPSGNINMADHHRIVNGSYANEGQFPMMAAVHLDFGDMGGMDLYVVYLNI